MKLVAQFDVGRRHGHDVKVIEIVAQALYHAVAVEDFQRHVDGRMAVAEAADQARHKVFGRAYHGHPQFAARESL
jgi:hypothetical protein